MAQAQKSSLTSAVPNDLEAFFMPFTANRAFKARPRLIARAKDMHYYTPEGRPILDGAAGPVVHQRRPQPRPDRRGDPEAGGRARLRADLPVRPSARLRAGQPDRGAGARRPRPCVLLQFRLGSRRHRAEDRARLLDRARARASARASSAASAAITASASAAWRSAASPTTARCSARCCPASIICRTPTTASSRPSPRASRNGARISPTSWSASSRCTATPPSPPSSSSRWPARPRCCRRRRAICSGCARSATSTASC